MIDNLHDCVYLDDPIACEEIHDEIIADTEEIESDEKKCVASEFYVVMGYNEQEQACLGCSDQKKLLSVVRNI